MRGLARIGIGLLVGAVASAAMAGESPDPELSAVHAHLRAHEFEAARDVVRGRLRDGRDSDDLRWSDAWSRLRRIDRHTGEMRLEQGAHAARDLGLYRLEYRLWNEMFAASTWAGPRTRGRWAGAAAIRTGRYEEGLELLAADEGCAAGERGDLVRAFASSDQGPRDWIDFAEHFWFATGAGWRHRRAAFEAIVRATNRADLDDALVDRAYPLAYRMAVLSRLDGWAQTTLRVWLGRRDEARVVPLLRAIHREIAEAHHRSGAELDAILLRVLPDTDLGPVALQRAAHVLDERGDDGLAEQAYRRVIAAVEPRHDKPYPESAEETRLHTALDSARLALARMLEESGRPAAALALYRKWTAWTGCGNCSAAAAEQRSLHEARCLVAMGRVEEALAKHLWPHYTSANPMGGPCAALIDFHVTLMADRGELDLLDARISQFASEGATARAAASVARRFVAIRRARDAGDLDALVGVLVDASRGTVFHAAVYEDWEIPLAVRRVTEVLALRADAVAALERRFDAIASSGKDADAARGVLVHALFVLPSPAAREALGRIRDRVRSGEKLGLAPEPLERRIEERDFGL